MAASGVSFFVALLAGRKDYLSYLAIIPAVVISAAFGLRQDGKAARIISALPGLRDKQPVSPQIRLGRLKEVYLISLAVVCGVIFLAGLLWGEPPLFILTAALSLAAAVLPGRISSAAGLVCARGAEMMAGRGIVLRKLSAVKLMGKVSVVISGGICGGDEKAVSFCKGAGICPVIISENESGGLIAAARESGVITSGAQIISGAGFADLDDGELLRSIEKYRVYTQVNAEDRQRIIKAWQRNGAVVATAGCARSGADITFAGKNRSGDIILGEEGFSAAAQALAVGKGVCRSIQSAFCFLLGCNLGLCLAVIFAVVFGMGVPFLPAGILFISIIAGFPLAELMAPRQVDGDIILKSSQNGTETASIYHTGTRKSRPWRRFMAPQALRGAMGAPVARVMIWGGTTGACAFAAFLVGSLRFLSVHTPPSLQTGMAMAFLSFCFGIIFLAMSCHGGQLARGGISNKADFHGPLIVLGIMVLLCVFPFLGSILGVAALSMYHWIILLGLSGFPVLAEEGVKLLFRIQTGAA
jgi:magnesium-transporting ATPase (P-type)